MIEWGRSGSEENVQTFRDVAELRAYTKETGKIFRNTFDQEGGNVVLRHLLRKNLLRELIKARVGMLGMWKAVLMMWDQGGRNATSSSAEEEGS